VENKEIRRGEKKERHKKIKGGKKSEGGGTKGVVCSDGEGEERERPNRTKKWSRKGVNGNEGYYPLGERRGVWGKKK